MRWWLRAIGACLLAVALGGYQRGPVQLTDPGTAAAGLTFDLQAHRGGLGLYPESSLTAFEHALRLGVSTLELDVQLTADNVAVVTHDRRTNPVVCRDTAPGVAGDPDYP